MRKELPLKHLEEPKEFDKEGTCSEVFEFEPEKDKKYVYKEIRRESFGMHKYPGETLEAIAISMKKFYTILKEHFGDKIVNTHYIVAKNKEGKPCIMIVQEKIDGTRYDKLDKNDPKFQEVSQQVKEIDILYKNLGKNQELEEKNPVAFNIIKNFWDLTYEKNIIVDKKGNIKIIDW